MWRGTRSGQNRGPNFTYFALLPKTWYNTEAHTKTASLGSFSNVEKEIVFTWQTFKENRSPFHNELMNL
jgi:hypothetical protein